VVTGNGQRETGIIRPWADAPLAGGAPLEGRRADAGEIRLTGRDVRGLLWCGQMYGVRADHLAALLGASADVVRQVHARWRRAGLAATGRLGPGPGWCWLTRAGLEACGLPYEPKRPPLARLAHVHAVSVARLAFERWDVWPGAAAWWRSERHLRWLRGAGVGQRGHVPDGEIIWPDGGHRYAGQVWCVEVELTPKTVARTAGIMAGLLARTCDLGAEDERWGSGGPRYARVVYLAAPAARATVERARASLADRAAWRVEVRDLPAGAL